ncbi:MAG: DUF3368 domain-containing protein [Planctomycetota bacterium]
MPNVISNTTPLQYLPQIGQLNLLPRLCGTIRVPRAVVDELAVGHSRGISLPHVAACSWIDVCDVDPDSANSFPILGGGEAEVLALARTIPDALVLLDDAEARRTAFDLGLAVRETLGVLLDAKRAGLIPAATPLLDQLHGCGFRLSPATRRTIIELAEE